MDWFRWWHGSSDDPKLRMIASECNIPVASVIGLWATILEAASKSQNRGIIDNFDYEVVSFHLGIDAVTPCNAMKHRNMLHETDGTLTVLNWGKWQPKRERDDNSTGRVREFRSKQKQALTDCNADETPCNASETNVTPREEKRREYIKEVNTLVVSKLTPCPHQEILGLYAKHLPELPQPRIWEGARANNLKSRWSWVMSSKASTKEEGLDFFSRLFEYISKSDFLMGRSGSWNCDLGWIVNATNFSKIIDGNYDNKAAA